MKTTHKPVNETEIETLLNHIRTMSENYHKNDPPNLRPTFQQQRGRVNTKIVKSIGGSQRSVYAFVENATGKIMKAAGWNAPEPKRYERGNVNNPETWEGCCTPYGIVYLK